MSPKDFYKHYQADDNTVLFNYKLADEIIKFKPNHVLEFGCGTGKNLKLLQRRDNRLPVVGLDISLINVINTSVRNDIKCVILGDESYLRHLANFDVVFTCSVLDHIENITGIVREFKRICNVAVVIAECLAYDPTNFYWNHDYESMGFHRIKNSYYLSPADGREYYIWQWNKKLCVESPAQ